MTSPILNPAAPKLSRADAATLDALGIKFDANETNAFARELEHVRKTIVETEYPAFRARDFIPMEPGVDPGADTFTWYRFDRVGVARMLANYANDIPNVGEYGVKQNSPIETIASQYSYTKQDLRAAAMYGRALSPRLALLNREAIERKIESVACLGDSARGIAGFSNASGVPTLSSGLTLNWDSSTAAQILADLQLIAITVWTQSMFLHKCNQILCGTDTYAKLSTKVYSDYTGETILSVFQKANPGIAVDPWVMLDNADAGGDGERLIAYEKSPQNASLIIPLEYSEAPPQASGFQFNIPAEARIGGVVVYKPLSMVYVDALMD